jgi:hypothetical protein
MSEQHAQRSDPAAEHPASRRTKLIYLARNYISFGGFFLVGLGLLLLCTFALFTFVAPTVNPYFGIVGYMIVPSIFVGGLALVPAGMILKHRRLLRQASAVGAPVVYPALDLNDPRARAWVAVFLGFSLFVVLPVLGVSSYYGYHFTDSVEFCGQVCHTVMEPQAVAHANSPHARVTCAECHIGAGASWFVKAKITGVGQVIAVARDSFSRPIPSAIRDLRPARETCEQCHWPAQFFGYLYRQFIHFSADEVNTRREVRMMLKVGGQERTLSPDTAGIHVHMLLLGTIEYVATDPDLQEIPWVRHNRPDGQAVVYRSDGQPASTPRPEGTVRTVDCMDCHNLTAHGFRSPQVTLDSYLEQNLIDRTLPFIKREAVAALVTPYADNRTAEDAIGATLRRFYEQSYPAIWQDRQAKVEQAVAGVTEIYKRNFFPEMRVNWQTYPDNVGHLISPGCFRCHDGRHVSDAGHAISSDCSVCHVAINALEEPPGAFVEGQFHHAMSLIGHEDVRCSECHTGGTLPSCAACHETGWWLKNRGKTLLRRGGD